MLAGWGYTDQQQIWLKEWLDRVAGVRIQYIWTYGQEMVLERLNLGKPEPPPFLLGVLFTILNPSFSALTAVRMLGAIHKGRWSYEDCTYVQFFRDDLLRGADVGCQMSVAATATWGTMGHVSHRSRSTPAQVDFCNAVAQDCAGPRIRMIPCAGRLGSAYGQPSNLPVELATLLEGRYVISKIEQNTRPIFRKNLVSWTDNPEAQEALWPAEVATMLWRGTFEYIEQGLQMPLAIMAVSAVPESGAPLLRLVIDTRPINLFADKWNVQYISIKSLRLIPGPKSLFWTVDLKSSKHLCVFWGCSDREKRS